MELYQGDNLDFLLSILEVPMVPKNLPNWPLPVG